MEPDRFDDVAYTVTEEPQPLSERSRLRRRVATVLTAATVAFGGMAAAADAITDNGEAGQARRRARASPRTARTTGAATSRAARAIATTVATRRQRCATDFSRARGNQ